MKFKFYEIIRVKTNQIEKSAINGLSGVVTGYSKSEFDDVEDGYAVLVIKDEIVWQLSESEMISMGKNITEEEYYKEKYLEFAEL